MTVVTGTARASQAGPVQFGFGQFNSTYSLDYSNEFVVLASSPKRTAAIGLGHLGVRVPVRPIEYVIPSTGGNGGTRPITIEIGSISGAIIGKIRNDIQKPIIQSCEFTLNEMGGCADFTLKLSARPPFPIPYGATVKFILDDTAFTWYQGAVDYADDIGTQREFYEFRGNGFSRYFDTMKGEGSYTADDVGQIVYQILQDNVIGECPINYNPSKLDLTTGVTTTNTIEVGKYPLKKVFDTFAQMAGAVWGVDGDGDFYFQILSADSIRNFFVGYDIQIFDPKTNLDAVKNIITVQRKESLGTGGSGWVVAGVYNNDSSAKKYGRRELNFQGPGFWGQEEADIVGNSLRDELSEPQISGNLTGIVLSGEAEYLPRGAIKVITQPTEYDEVVLDLDDSTLWSKTGSGDSAAFDDTDFFTWADGSVRFDFVVADGDIWQTNADFDGNIQKVRFYIRTNTAGSFLTFGFGAVAWNEHTAKVDINSEEVFLVIDWDVSALDVSRIGKFGFSIDQDFSDNISIWVDKLEVHVKGHRHYNFDITKSKYMIEPNSQTVSVEAGVVPPKMENYLAGLFAQSSEIKYTGEVV